MTAAALGRIAAPDDCGGNARSGEAPNDVLPWAGGVEHDALGGRLRRHPPDKKSAALNGSGAERSKR